MMWETHFIPALLASLLAVAGYVLPVTVSIAEESPQQAAEAKEEHRAKILKMRDETLERLFKTHPEAKKEFDAAAGYAVFDASGLNLLLLVGADGEGVLVDNQTGKPVFMDMRRAGTGLGLGKTQFKQIMIFNTPGALDYFRDNLGVEIAAQAGVEIGGKDNEKTNKRVSAVTGMSVYQFTDKGFAIQANWGGFLYKKSADLN